MEIHRTTMGSALGCTICSMQYRMALCQIQGTMLPSPTQLTIPIPSGIGVHGIGGLLVLEEADTGAEAISMLRMPE